MYCIYSICTCCTKHMMVGAHMSIRAGGKYTWGTRLGGYRKWSLHLGSKLIAAIRVRMTFELALTRCVYGLMTLADGGGLLATIWLVAAVDGFVSRFVVGVWYVAVSTMSVMLGAVLSNGSYLCEQWRRWWIVMAVIVCMLKHDWFACTWSLYIQVDQRP